MEGIEPVPNVYGEMFALGGFVVAVLMAVGTAWWRIHVSINETGDKTRKAISELAAQNRQDLADLRASLERHESETDTKIAALSARVALHESALADHRTHVAETYISREGLREAMQPVSMSLTRIDESLRTMSGRLDRVFERAPPGA